MVTNRYYPNFLEGILKHKVGVKEITKDPINYHMRLCNNPEINCRYFVGTGANVNIVYNSNMPYFKRSNKNFYVGDFNLLLFVMKLHNFIDDNGYGRIIYGSKRLEIRFSLNEGIKLSLYHNKDLYINIQIFINEYDILKARFYNKKGSPINNGNIFGTRNYEDIENIFQEFTKCRSKRNSVMRFLFKNKSKYVKDW